MIAGMDEAGRGPWAGPVVAAAVIFPPGVKRPKGLADSKALTAEARDTLFLTITACAHYGIGLASPAEIDTHNIRQATFLAMRRALAALPTPPHACLVDGHDAPEFDGMPVEAIIDGDAHVPLISAASILAKVHRDRLMVEACATFPGYGFAQHKGYGVPAHAAALHSLGPCPLHRRSFKPVRAVLGGV
jgi:ribonuclease HII